MKTQTTIIRKIVQQLNQDFWLPNIQRNFVWKEVQIERLFDSLMRDYPIGTLLVWKTKSDIKHRKFIDIYKNDTNFTDFYVPENDNCKLLVLDGQQRLQSLFIGLCGSYNGKELYFDLLSGANRAPEDVKYIFKFSKNIPKNTPSEIWIKLKDIVFKEEGVYSAHKNILDSLKHEITEEQKTKIGTNIDTVHQVFKTEERIVYQEFDSIDRPELYSDDDIVEIFIRANSGGTPLGKSDLLFSLLTSDWQEAEEKMVSLLGDLNQGGYAFTRDFVLKTCLTLLGTGASYKIEKFRKPEIRDRMMNEWDRMEDSIRAVKDFLYGNTYLRSEKSLKSYLTLIPVIYFRYHYADKWNDVRHLNNYILRTLLAGSFGGSPDSLIDSCIKEINEREDFNTAKMFNVIQRNGRSLQISKDELLGQNYGKRNDLHLIFNIWYKEIDFTPSYSGNELEIDHIFPTKLLKKEVGPDGRSLRYKKDDRDQLGNLMLLTKDENGPGGKGASSPEDWFQDKSQEYLKKHLIPDNPDLWKTENFEYFLGERKKKIVEKFRNQFGLLIKEARNP